MPFVHRRKPWQLGNSRETPEQRVLEWDRLRRREMLQALVAGGLAAAIAPSSALAATLPPARESGFPAPRNQAFQLDRPITSESAAARYNNFYEFSTTKRVAPLVKSWEIGDWRLEVSGLVERPVTLTMEELGRLFPYEERLYRHRCVEAWSMALPWTGFPLKLLMDHVQPLSAAKFVRFVSFDHTKVPGGRRDRRSPWPYTEGLTIPEAANDLTLIVTGMYGHPLWKQHGAPVRLVVPWKYGFKSAKSLVKIEFVMNRPATFWNTLIAREYDFEANVNPNLPHPRWSQAFEKDIGTGTRHRTLPYNGYADLVADLY